MSFFVFVIFVVLILCAAWFYQWLKRVEGEIRAELAEEAETSESASEMPAASVGAGEEPVTEAVVATETEGTEAVLSAEDLVLDVIRAHSRIRQTEIYDHVPGMNKRKIQEVIRALEKEGRIRRTRDRGSYILETA
ncbi:MAG: hypothetical protein Tsb0017_16090 [Geothermobacteraceae bacterium]